LQNACGNNANNPDDVTPSSFSPPPAVNMLTGLIRLLALASLLALGACSTTRSGGYFEDDGPGQAPPDVANIADAVPKSEPLARSGNKPYDVYGKTYVPMSSAIDYRERGVASWYGKKFHGRRTSSGEPYDMYTMTAAHKTLPLPSFVRVRNLENGRSTIVRVNDRGPFLHNRLIDLSYAAAAKLGIVGTGTGLVEVETVTAPDTAPVQVAKPKIETRGLGMIATAEAAPLPPAPVVASTSTAALAPASASVSASAPPATTPKLFVQAGAFREWDNAEAMRTRLERQAYGPILVQSVLMSDQTRVYRVRIGPVATVADGDRISAALASQGVREPVMIVE
jgi:rare lipoprotein A